jgi:hypothetical protein
MLVLGKIFWAQVFGFGVNFPGLRAWLVDGRQGMDKQVLGIIHRTQIDQRSGSILLGFSQFKHGQRSI